MATREDEIRLAIARCPFRAGCADCTGRAICREQHRHVTNSDCTTCQRIKLGYMMKPESNAHRGNQHGPG